MNRWILLVVLLAAQTGRGAAPGPPAAPSWCMEESHTPRQPRSGEAVTISMRTGKGIATARLEYQVVDAGAYIELKDTAYGKNWVAVSMGMEKATADGKRFSVVLPGELQKHRRLIRYRFSAVDAAGKALGYPAADSPSRNLAYFVYDGVPAWSGAITPRARGGELGKVITFSPEEMRRVQVYQFIGKKLSVENVTWNEQAPGKEYKYTGTLVVDGEVFDHVKYRARGGVWRYAMGKNMWKFDLPDDHHLKAMNDWGKAYPAKWSKINLRPCIQLGTYGWRGEQGMFESVGFRLFNMVGVAAPFTHWVQLRIIDQKEESPADQYQGDFWGLYLAIENEDGKFLKDHDLPDGNLYKMAGGTGTLAHHGEGLVADGSDLRQFQMDYERRVQPERWWRDHLDLPKYYSYRAIVECIHHYDIGDGKNYDYFNNPTLKQWQVIPWDIDETWADNMYGNGEEPFNSRVLEIPRFRIEYQNRLREIRDLLFNPEQTGWLIDQFAAVPWDPSGKPSLVEADRRKWDFHPALAIGGQAGQGLFYQASATRDFPGIARRMKEYVQARSAWIDAALLNDRLCPQTPIISYAGAEKHPADQLRFRAGPYVGAGEFAGMKWRLAEVRRPDLEQRREGVYEIAPLWESEESPRFGSQMSLPKELAKAGHTYRVRVRMKDVTGRWSHWSAPVEFEVGK